MIDITQKASHTLPPDLTEFLGRESEIERISELMETNRLITVVGPGGVGKTRLVTNIARHRAARFTHGVYYAPLESLSAASQIPAALADALGLSHDNHPAPETQVVNFIAAKNLLLVVDNFEHLLDGADLLAEILSRAPEATLLVSSRVRLGLYGEAVFELRGLSTKGTRDSDARARHGDAVRLFISSARRAGARVPTTDDSLAQVERICEYLDGLPLAIELAAAWTKLITVPEIAGRVASDIDFLTASWRNVPERHRSVRAVCDHSWQLLGNAERRAARALSVFRGPIRPEAARRVAVADLDTLSELVDKSIAHGDPIQGLEIHGILRQYAAEKLAEDGDELARVSERHSAYFAAFLRDQEAALLAGEGTRALRHIAVELDNIRAAWRWALERGAIDRVEQCIDGLYRFHDIRSRFRDGEELFAEAVERLAAAETALPRVRPTLLRIRARQAMFRHRLGQSRDAERMLRANLAKLDALDGHCDASEIGFCLAGLASIAISRGDYRESRSLLERARSALSDTDPRSTVGRLVEANVLRNLGNVRFARGDYHGARSSYLQCLHRCDESGDRQNAAMALGHLGAAAYHSGDFTAALAYHERSRAIFTETDNLRGQVRILTQMADMFQRQGLFDRALDCLAGAGELCERTGNVQDRAVTVGLHGIILDQLGDYRSAAIHVDEALLSLRDIGDQLFGLYFAVIRGLIDDHEGAHDAARARAARAMRAAQSISARTVESDAAIVLGNALHALGRASDAADAYRQARAVGRAVDRPIVVSEASAGLARLALDRSDIDEAVAWTAALPSPLGAEDLAWALEPLRLLWTHHRVLAASGDARAGAVLTRAHDLLRQRARTIADPELRRSFLERVPSHSEIVRAVDGRAPAVAAASAEVAPLSKRELEILHCVAEGSTNQQIAERLFISVNTVKRHMSNVFAKLEVKSRTAAVARGRDLGVLCDT